MRTWDPPPMTFIDFGVLTCESRAELVCLPVSIFTYLLRHDKHYTTTDTCCSVNQHRTLHLPKLVDIPTMSKSREAILDSSQPREAAHPQAVSPRDNTHTLLTSASLKQMHGGSDAAADARALNLAGTSSSRFLCRAVRGVGLQEPRPLVSRDAM